MSLRPEPVGEIPAETARVARAAFPKGTVVTRLRDEFDALYADEDFRSLYPARGQPGLTPWRLALVTVFQFLEHLSDRQAADAVRARIDWKYALGLELTDPGFHFSVLGEFRARLVAGGAEHLLLDTMLERFKARGLVRARGKQRTGRTHVLAAVRDLSFFELVAETLRAALDDVAAVAPDWLRAVAQPVWFERYGRRVEDYRLPKSREEREALALVVGADGFVLLDALDAPDAPAAARALPMVRTLRDVWRVHYAPRCCRDPTGSTRGPIEVAGRPFVWAGMPALPFKLNQDRRRHIPEQTRKVTNWRDYDESLRRRGSLTVWFSDEAVEAWEAERRTSRGGQPEYSDLAILTALTFKAVFRLAYRQTEGLIGSVIGLLGLDLAVPDHTTLCRRAETLEVPRPKPRGDGAGGGAGGDTGPMHLLVDSTGLKLYGAGEGLGGEDRPQKRRAWRKLHLGMDAETGRIVAATLTDRDEDDAAQVGPLLDQIADPVASVTADGAYDQESVYADVAERHPGADVVVPPRSTAVPSATAETAPTQRDRHLQLIAEKGRMGWQKASGYNARARAEATVGRFKQVIGDGLRSRADGRRATEMDVAVQVLNRMLELGRPESARIA